MDQGRVSYENTVFLCKQCLTIVVDSYEAMKQCLFQGLFRHRIFELLVGEVILMLPDVFSHLCS